MKYYIYYHTQNKYRAFVLTTTFERIDDHFCAIQADLSRLGMRGWVLFDQRTCNGNLEDNRFFEAYFNGEALEISSVHQVHVNELYPNDIELCNNILKSLKIDPEDCIMSSHMEEL